MERAQTAEILRSGLLQTHIIANNLDDIGLLLDELCEVGGHRDRPDSPPPGVSAVSFVFNDLAGDHPSICH